MHTCSFHAHFVFIDFFVSLFVYLSSVHYGIMAVIALWNKSRRRLLSSQAHTLYNEAYLRYVLIKLRWFINTMRIIVIGNWPNRYSQMGPKKPRKDWKHAKTIYASWRFKGKTNELICTWKARYNITNYWRKNSTNSWVYPARRCSIHPQTAQKSTYEWRSSSVFLFEWLCVSF